jgi:hypothetical protein
MQAFGRSQGLFDPCPWLKDFFASWEEVTVEDSKNRERRAKSEETEANSPLTLCSTLL